MDIISGSFHAVVGVFSNDLCVSKRPYNDLKTQIHKTDKKKTRNPQAFGLISIFLVMDYCVYNLAFALLPSSKTNRHSEDFSPKVDVCDW
jgi:hypothetical protein